MEGGEGPRAVGGVAGEGRTAGGLADLERPPPPGWSRVWPPLTEDVAQAEPPDSWGPW